MKLRSGVVAAAFGLVVGLSAASAFADAIPPDVSACDGKTAGASCSVTVTSPAGVCQNATCSKLDYSHLDDAGQPGTVSYACLQCKSTDGGTSSGDGGEAIPDGHGGCNAAGARAAGTFALALLPLLALRAFGRRKTRKE